jgi:cytochrome c-type biogenesis protein CcmF
MVQEKRGMLKVWNASLIAGTFVLSLLGTFLVRSGVLSSIHAFGASTLGTPFLIFIGICAVGSVVLIVSRAGELRSEAKLDSLMSREAFFLLNNLVLVALCVVIAWGTYFPLISELITGTKESVGPPFFNRITTPLALLLVLLAGIGPMLAWRRGTVAGAMRVFGFPIACALVALLAMLVLTPAAESVTSLIMFTFVAFVFAAIGQEFWRGARARRVTSREPLPVALYQLVVRNRRRYGGYLVHAGFATLLLGVAASSAFADQRDVRLTPGQSANVGGYRLTYVKPTVAFLDDKAGTGAPITLGAVVDVRKGGQHFTFRPGRNYYPTRDPAEGVVGRFFNGESNSEVSVKWGPLGNFWTAAQPDISMLQAPIAYANRHFANISSPDQLAIIVAATLRRYLTNRPPVTFTAIHSPMIMWIWMGGLIVIIGSLTALWPSPEARRRRASSLAAARLGRELSRA